MSLKSRRKRERQGQAVFKPPRLDDQKQIMWKTAYGHLGVAVTLSVLLLIGFALCFGKVKGTEVEYILYGAVAMLLIMIVYYAVQMIRTFSIAMSLDQVQCSSEETRHICCKRVGYIKRTVTKYQTETVCVVFTDHDGVKYYYVTPGFADCGIPARRSKLRDVEMELVCYKDTRFVKAYRIGI